MIDKRELRVGNLVYPNSNNPELVKCIANFSEDYAYFTDGGWENFKFLRPIPITPEWLIRMGANVTDNKSYSTGNEVSYKVYYLGRLVYNEIQDLWWYDGRLLVGLKPKFVHTFQNLIFALTGKELEINPES